MLYISPSHPLLSPSVHFHRFDFQNHQLQVNFNNFSCISDFHQVIMPRLPSSSRSQSASTTPRSSAANWPRSLLNSHGSPSTDGGHTAASPSEGSHRVSSSDGDHYPIHGNGNQAKGNGWHGAFHQENSEANNTEESGINGNT
ncbi:hypothetical protein MKW98_018879 [Papaver atlanticum]|uniref:Uncharacterized protein n=1 Tax=Papaver atlanticum TaxID=357466 RepID=A0AAD4TJ25_9MAGN|nr:hypothetical protein MKW98_018879 [Papaver atlanticum]